MAVHRRLMTEHSNQFEESHKEIFDKNIKNNSDDSVPGSPVTLF